MSVFDESQSGTVPFWLKDTQSKKFLCFVASALHETLLLQKKTEHKSDPPVEKDRQEDHRDPEAERKLGCSWKVLTAL